MNTVYNKETGKAVSATKDQIATLVKSGAYSETPIEVEEKEEAGKEAGKDEGKEAGKDAGKDTGKDTGKKDK